MSGDAQKPECWKCHKTERIMKFTWTHIDDWQECFDCHEKFTVEHKLYMDFVNGARFDFDKPASLDDVKDFLITDKKWPESKWVAYRETVAKRKELEWQITSKQIQYSRQLTKAGTIRDDISALKRELGKLNE